MKSTLIKLLGMGVLSIFFSCNQPCSKEHCGDQNRPDSARQKRTGVATLVEDELDLSKHPVEEQDAEAEFSACDDFISVQRLRKIERDAEEIKIEAFGPLKTLANNSVPSGAQYIIGLKITYGLKPLVGEMDLLYTPVYMVKLRDSLVPTANPQEKWGIYLVVDNPAYYTYNTSTGSFVVTSDYDCIEKYRSNIKIDHNGNTNGGQYDFNANLDGAGDVRSVIFSFQEIDAVIAMNEGTKTLKIFNACVGVPYSGTTIMKHSLLLGPDTKNPDFANPVYFSGFYDKYANLGHLCPPGCSTARFQLKYNP